MKKRYEKLIRDKVPEFIKGEYKVRQLSNGLLLDALRAKIFEEVLEFIESDDIEELADIQEVMYAILARRRISAFELSVMRLKKRQLKGGFEDGLFLEWVEVDE